MIAAALKLMAIGRLALGAVSIARPAAAARGFGLDDELTALTGAYAVFGAARVAADAIER